MYPLNYYKRHSLGKSRRPASASDALLWLPRAADAAKDCLRSSAFIARGLCCLDPASCYCNVMHCGAPVKVKNIQIVPVAAFK